LSRRVAAGLLLTVLSLALGLAVDHLGAIDDTVFRALAMREGATPHWAIVTAQALTMVGDLWLRLATLAIAIGAFVAAARRREAVVLVAGTLAAVVATAAIKEMFGRPRPSIVPHLADFANPSFPSGHASNTMAMLLLIAMLARRQWAVTGAVGVALAVGWSRVALGVHWPTDVIGGWLLGAGIALIAAGTRWHQRGAMRIAPSRRTSSPLK
jgi:undecaprenyl-diphosphatase